MRRRTTPRILNRGFDADYQAILDEATTFGYTKPSISQQIIQNQLVLDLKFAGVWSKLDLLHVFATNGDSDFVRINWVNPANKTNSGFDTPTNDGCTSIISSPSTNFTPSIDAVNFQLTEYSLGWRCGNTINIDTGDFVLSNQTGGTYHIFCTNGTLRRVNINQSVPENFYFSGDPSLYEIQQMAIITRTGTTNAVYLNGAVRGGLVDVNAPDGICDAPLIYLERSGTNSTLVQMGFIGGHLTATESNDFNTAFDEYISAL